MKSLLRIILFSLCCRIAIQGAHASNIEYADNLNLDSAVSSITNKPLVLFVTASDCHYCEILRENLFQFLPSDDRFILREVVMDSGLPVTNFNKSKISHSQLAQQLGVNFSPTVLFLGNDGSALTEPLEGVLTLEYYRYYFERSLQEANRAIQKKIQSNSLKPRIKIG